MSRFSALLVAERLAAESRARRAMPFLAPLLRGGRARFRVAGLIHEVRVADARPGWWICRQRDACTAEMESPADPWQRAEYLGLWPALRLVLMEPLSEGTWLAVPFNPSDAAQRFRLSGPLLLRLVEGGQPFERVIGRVEGGTLWYDEPDRRGDPAIAEDLRLRLAGEHAQPNVRGLGPGEKLAYALRWSAVASAQLRQQEASDQARTRAALALGGATLVGVERTPWGLRVTWERAGQRSLTVVDDRLAVISSGICLSGRDGDFDLTSLVSVMEAAIWGNEVGELE